MVGVRKPFFTDRVDAGRQLADNLSKRSDLTDPDNIVVLGLPRGGVPVAAEVAKALGAELDVLVVRKLGVPYRPELAMGAVGEDGITVLNDDILERAQVTAAERDDAIRTQQREVEQRAVRFRPHRRKPAQLHGKTALIVDDGAATGATAQVAGQLAQARGADRVLLLIPVAPYVVFQQLSATEDFDEVLCLYTPVRFNSVGAYYTDFAQVSDTQVRDILGA